jgi:hypothetical protein
MHIAMETQTEAFAVPAMVVCVLEYVAFTECLARNLDAESTKRFRLLQIRRARLAQNMTLIKCSVVGLKQTQPRL